MSLKLRTTIVVAIAGALLGVATGCGAKPAGNDPGRLVYDVGPQHGTARAGLFIVDDEGRNRRRLTSEPPPTSVTYAEWSPNGGTILFQSELSAAEEFWTIEADGTGLRRIGKGGGASWSPDGSEIAIGDGSDEISIVDKHGAPRRTMRLGLEEGLYPDPLAAWSPDGSLIAVNVLAASTESVIHVVATDGKSRAKLLGKREEGVSEEFAAWSPDGKAIAFIRVYGDASHGDELWVMRPNGSARHRMGVGAQDAWWSSDGRSLLFSASHPRAPGLYRVPIEGGDPVRIGQSYHLTADLREPGGKRVLRYDHGMLVVSRLDGSGRKVLTEPYQDAAPHWSPDGTRIAFTRGSEGEERWDVYVVGADGKGERRIAVDGSPVWLRGGRLLISRAKGFAVADLDPNRIAMPVDGDSPAISPDGAWIAFLRHRAVHTGAMPPPEDLLDVQSFLFLQRPDGTGSRVLAKTPGSGEQPSLFDTPVWAPDGRSILIEEHDPLAGGSARVRRVPVGEREEKTVARDDGSSLEFLTVAPDGKRIAFATSSGIDVVDLDKAQRKTVVLFDRVNAEALDWSPDGDKLAYVVNDYEGESVYELYVVDADGSNRQLVSKPGDAVGTFDWAPR